MIVLITFCTKMKIGDPNRAVHMSMDRRLEHELDRNLQAEEALIEELNADRTVQLVILNNEQQQIEMQRAINRVDMTSHYLARDDAFFKSLSILQQLRSQVKLVTDYHQPVPMPPIPQADARILSMLEKHDQKQSDYLAAFEEYVIDKKTHEKTIENITMWINDIYQQINAIIIPSILYFLLKYLPPLMDIYRFFAPNNALDSAIKQGQILDTSLRELENRITAEDTRFYKTWAPYPEFPALAMNEAKLIRLRSEELRYEQLLESKRLLDGFIVTTNQTKLSEAFAQYNSYPNYFNVFHLCTRLCESKFDDQKLTDLVDQSLAALGKLYPEIQTELQQFAQATLQNLGEADVFYLLRSKYDRLIDSSKNLQHKGKLAEKRMGDIAVHSTSLHPNNDAKKIYEYKIELSKLNTYVEGVRAELARRRKFIVHFKHFLNNRTGESLKNLYWFMNDPANQQGDFANLLKKLYPAALETMEAELQSSISINTRDIIALQESYLKKLLLIQGSTDQKMLPFKQMATALKQLLTKAEWTWEDFKTLESASHANPQYFQNPTLAELMTKTTQLVTASRQFKAKFEIQHAIPITQPVELTPTQTNALPTFFQPPNTTSAANVLIRDILGHINLFSIRFSDQKSSSEEKQDSINLIGANLLRYIKMLSEADTSQTISPQHLALLQEIGRFIQQLSSQTETTVDFEHVNSMLLKLDPEHPIRKGTEFLTNLYRRKTEFMAIDTHYAQMQVEKDIAEELHALDADYARVQKRKSSTTLSTESSFNLHHWKTAGAFKIIIKDYLTNLEQYPSPHNADETIAVKKIGDLVDKIYGILRYEPNKHIEVPHLFEELEQSCEELGSHPINRAAQITANALKETREYTSSSVSTPRAKR